MQQLVWLNNQTFRITYYNDKMHKIEKHLSNSYKNSDNKQSRSTQTELHSGHTGRSFTSRYKKNWLKNEK